MARSDLAGKRVGIYARYSSDRQRESSIDDQVHRCREFAEERGATAPPDLVFADRATSGASMARAGLEALLAAAAAGRIDAVITEDVSRLSRDLADAATIFRQLQYDDVPLLGVADGVDSREKSSKLTFGVRALLADAYLEDLRDKTRRGLKGRHLAGLSTGGLPYAYRSQPVTGPTGDVTGHSIHIVEEQADVVRRIFDRYVAGASHAAIARELNADRIDPPRSSVSRRKGWTSSTVRSILHPTKYAGVWSFNQR